MSPPKFRGCGLTEKGPGEKGAPRKNPEIMSEKVANFECRFPYDSYGRDRAPFCQQLTYGVVSEGGFRGNSAEILRKVRGNYVLLRQKRVRKFRGNLRKIFCNDPFPNDSISELLILALFRRRILGQYPAAPCSLGPFDLLLTLLPAVNLLSAVFVGQEGHDKLS